MKLHTIHIENYKSLRDVTIRLQDVNLFIGPNNSGKSNALKALQMLANRDLVGGLLLNDSDLFKKNSNNDFALHLVFELNNDRYLHCKTEKSGQNRHRCLFAETNIKEKPQFVFMNSNYTGNLNKVESFFENMVVFSINPSTFAKPTVYQQTDRINSDASNFMSFLVNLRENNKKIYKQIESDLYKCVKQFNEITIPSTNEIGTERTIRFFEPDEITSFLADEVSEGVLYFLALLCIVHQPNPPKILLLEEPEKGIHPRRIKEIMDYIFALAESKDIQIIMTTHSTQVVDEFKNVLENIFVFDKENGETIVRNLQTDIINKYNATFKNPINLNGSLGDHWASGFLGGVPL